MTKIPSFIELYRTLIATPSVSSFDASLDQSNEMLINLLANWFHDIGFKIEILKVPQTRNKFNMLASFGSGPGGLLLAGHSDTVSFDSSLWTRDPLVLTEHNNKFYGLGVVDMKGFFAFLLHILSTIDLSILKKPIYILATADEETSMAGANYFSHNTQIRPECAVIGEPTSLIPIYAHKGYVSYAITVIGKTGHSSNPVCGINAIEIMHDIISQLKILYDTLKQRYSHSIFDVPYPTINFGRIYGGEATNCICSNCELHIDIRPLPGMTSNDIAKLITNALLPINKSWPGRIKSSLMHPFIPGYECRLDFSLIQILEQLTGAKTQVVNYCTEASFIQTLCPTLILGPGSINQAHQPDEFIDMSFIKPANELIMQIIQYITITGLSPMSKIIH